MSSIYTIKQLPVKLTREQADYAKWQCYLLTKYKNMYIEYAWNQFQAIGKLMGPSRFDKEVFQDRKSEFYDPCGNPLLGQARQSCGRYTYLTLAKHARGYRKNGAWIKGDQRPPFVSFKDSPYATIHFANTMRYLALSPSYIYIPYFKEVKVTSNDNWVTGSDLQYVTGGDLIWDFRNDKWAINLHLEVPMSYYHEHKPIAPYDPKGLGVGIDLGYSHLITRTTITKYLPHIDHHPNPLYDTTVQKLEKRINNLTRVFFHKIRCNLGKAGYDYKEYLKGGTHKTRIQNELRERGQFDSVFYSRNLMKIRKKLAHVKRKLWRYKQNMMRQIAMDIVREHPNFICMEHLIASDMRSKQKVHGHATLRRYNSRVPYFMMRRYIQWACEKYNIVFILADRYFPSSQRCGLCGHRGSIIGFHDFQCSNPKCPGFAEVQDRDENAANNLFRYGIAEDQAIPIDDVYDRLKYVSIAIPHQTYMNTFGHVKFHNE